MKNSAENFAVNSVEGSFENPIGKFGDYNTTGPDYSFKFIKRENEMNLVLINRKYYEISNLSQAYKLLKSLSKDNTHFLYPKAIKIAKSLHLTEFQIDSHDITHICISFPANSTSIVRATDSTNSDSDVEYFYIDVC
jgi:hypothetical protein